MFNINTVNMKHKLSLQKSEHLKKIYRYNLQTKATSLGICKRWLRPWQWYYLFLYQIVWFVIIRHNKSKKDSMKINANVHDIAHNTCLHRKQQKGCGNQACFSSVLWQLYYCIRKSKHYAVILWYSSSCQIFQLNIFFQKL